MTENLLSLELEYNPNILYLAPTVMGNMGRKCKAHDSDEQQIIQPPLSQTQAQTTALCNLVTLASLITDIKEGQATGHSL